MKKLNRVEFYQLYFAWKDYHQKEKIWAKDN